MSRRKPLPAPMPGAEPFVALPRGAKPSKSASTDQTRPALTHGYLRKVDDNWELLASDSYGLARIPVHVECANGSDPQTGAVPLDALKHAEKEGGFRIAPDGIEPCSRTGRASNVLYRQNGSAPQPPDWDKLLAAKAKKPFSVGLNTKILRNIAEALGTDAVELEFDLDSNLRPIRVKALTGASGDGLLMPVRLNV